MTYSTPTDGGTQLTTTTDTTIDFAPLLALRDELAQAPDGGLDGLCARIVAGDPEALIAGQAFLGREERLERELKAKLATMYDRTSEYAAKNELRADDGFGCVFDAIRATGELCTAIDDPDQYVAPTIGRPGDVLADGTVIQ